MPAERRALVVDDSEDIRFLLTRVLALDGFDVIQAAGGAEALEVLEEAADPPHVVVLDVQMPDMDGWETLQEIRARPATAGLNVVMCTVKGRAADLVHGWELGCDAFVTKPFDIDLLRDEVKAVVARRPAERLQARRAGLQEARRILETMGRVSAEG